MCQITLKYSVSKRVSISCRFSDFSGGRLEIDFPYQQFSKSEFIALDLFTAIYISCVIYELLYSKQVT